MPPRPMTDRSVRSPRFTLAALEACFETMCGFGDTGPLPPRCPRGSVGERKIDLHPLLVVSGAGAEDAYQLLVAWWPPRRPRPHASCDHLDHPRPFGAGAHVDPLPGALVQRGTPDRDAVPGRRRRTA